MEWFGSWTNLKRCFKFELNEVRDIIISILVAGFILSFRYWGGTEFSWTIGFKNFLGMSLVAAFSILFVITATKIFGVMRYTEVVYKIWPFGLVFSLIFATFTNGWALVFFMGGFLYSKIGNLRIGELFQEIPLFTKSRIASVVPFTHFFLAIFFKILILSGKDTLLIRTGLIFNLLMAIYSVLIWVQFERFFVRKQSNLNSPGYDIWYCSRPWSIFMILFFILFSVLIYNTNIFISIIISALAGSIVALSYFWLRTIEKKG